MAVAFVAIFTQLRPTPAVPREQRIRLSDPLRALGHRRLLLASLVALLYNFGYFTILAYSPLPMGLGVHQLGVIFFSWGVLVAIGAIIVAPRLMRRYSTVTLLVGVMLLVAADLLVIGLGIHSLPTMVTAVILSGLVLGIGNALLMTMLLGVAHAQPAISASATNFVRFVGGALAPFLAGKLAQHVSVGAPLYMGAGAVLLGAATLMLAARTLDADEPVDVPAELAEFAEEELQLAA
jgi:predicted MFS family arabinose efflux permease